MLPKSTWTSRQDVRIIIVFMKGTFKFDGLGMNAMEGIPDWLNDYLRILNLPIEQPSLHYLRRLIHAQISAFPFENISKIARDSNWHKQMNVHSAARSFLDGHDRFGFGGTCFTLNWLFQSMLSELGFHCYTVMLSHQHMGIIVHMPEPLGSDFYVDCGAAAPLFEPANLESGENSCLRFGNERVIIRHRIAKSVHRFERYRNGVLSEEPWYFNTDMPQSLDDFLPLIHSSYEIERPFMSSLRCHRFGGDFSYYISLKNNRFQICYRDGRVFNHYLSSVQEIKETIQQIFGIDSRYTDLAISRIEQSGTNIFTHTAVTLKNPESRNTSRIIQTS